MVERGSSLLVKTEHFSWCSSSWKWNIRKCFFFIIRTHLASLPTTQCLQEDVADGEKTFKLRILPKAKHMFSKKNILLHPVILPLHPITTSLHPRHGLLHPIISCYTSLDRLTPPLDPLTPPSHLVTPCYKPTAVILPLHPVTPH